MLFRQLYDATSSTFTYLLACTETRQAILIDPVFEQFQRDQALLNELNLTLICVLDTHCHADHVTAAWRFSQSSGSRIASAAVYKAAHVDQPLQGGDRIEFGRHALECRATPGHTSGCMTFVAEDRSFALTGDALLIRGCGRCDFQQGNARQLYQSIQSQIFSLPDDCILYPGHDYRGRLMTTVGEEKRYNERIGGGASEEDFVGYMAALQLPHPKLIDYAVPANLRSGRPQPDDFSDAPKWGPVQYTYAGVPEVEVEWVLEHRDRLTLLDVRETSELDSPVDRIRATLVIPLSRLRSELNSIPTCQPVVCLCRSGRRSAMAVDILARAGFEQVANIRGGILRWKELS